MISEFNQSECFVYINLPGETRPVTAGKLVIRPDKSGLPHGMFVYGRSYLDRQDKVPIDPIELKLSDRVYETRALKGVFGAFRDAGPDHWGRQVLERHAGKPELSELDYLLLSPDDRAGALGFGLSPIAPTESPGFNQTLDLAQLQNVAMAVVNDEPLPDESYKEQVFDLMLVGTSMGGARPKTVVEDYEGLWLAKFNREDDKWNNARVEHAMLMLARSCGLTSATSTVVQVGNRDVLLVKRFDREKTGEGYTRARMLSALTLLRAEDTHSARRKWSYPVLAEELRRMSATPGENAEELFRRMCFNALISNIDDHPRNHAVIAKGHDWELSPAYDLTPFSPVSIERRDLAMICGDDGRRAKAANLLSQSNRFCWIKTQRQTFWITCKNRSRAHGMKRPAGQGFRNPTAKKSAAPLSMKDSFTNKRGRSKVPE
ncbi:MAG: HipA domain-containing protein [Gammaproteobacteria bacterium]|nr:HipA domain-containing protein [Gammaproteobacteria bacterium]